MRRPDLASRLPEVAARLPEWRSYGRCVASVVSEGAFELVLSMNATESKVSVYRGADAT